MRLCRPATFLTTSVCRRGGLRNRSAAARQIFILPIACSAATRRRDRRRLARSWRRVSRPPRGFLCGVRRGVPLYAVSPARGTPGGAVTRVRSYTFMGGPPDVGEDGVGDAGV